MMILANQLMLADEDEDKEIISATALPDDVEIPVDNFFHDCWVAWI